MGIGTSTERRRPTCHYLGWRGCERYPPLRRAERNDDQQSVALHTRFFETSRMSYKFLPLHGDSVVNVAAAPYVCTYSDVPLGRLFCCR